MDQAQDDQHPTPARTLRRPACGLTRAGTRQARESLATRSRGCYWLVTAICTRSVEWQVCERLETAFRTRGLPAPVQLHHAEAASIAVAVASVLAGAAFPSGLRQLGRAAGLQRPLPAGASDVPRLRATLQHILRAGGERAVRDYAKRYFKPVRQALSGT
jgi:hypothetical protein